MEKHLAALLAAKWREEYSRMVQYVRVRMTITVVPANSLLLHGSQDRNGARYPQIREGYDMLDWHTWHN